jgi:hypothetical protein
MDFHPVYLVYHSSNCTQEFLYDSALGIVVVFVHDESGRIEKLDRFHYLAGRWIVDLFHVQ